jgi:hypothetical protein
MSARAHLRVLRRIQVPAFAMVQRFLDYFRKQLAASVRRYCFAIAIDNSAILIDEADGW